MLGTRAYTGTAEPVVYAKLNNDASYTATATALSAPFCDTSSVLNLIVTKAGTATGDQVISCGDTTLSSNITLTGYVPAVLGTISGWQMADNPAFTLATTVPGSAGKAVLTPADVTGLSVTTYFRAMIVGCPTLYSNAVVVSYPTVTWNGVWNPGPPGPSDNVTVTSGTLTIAADLNICSLKINNTATVTVNPGVTLTVNGAVLVAGGAPGGTFRMLDDVTFPLGLGAASLMQNSATTVNANTGVATYERWIRTRKFDYTYWSSPLNPNTLQTVSPLTLSDKYLKFDSNTYTWTFPVNTTTMIQGVGYAIRGPQTGSGSSETVLQDFKGNFTGTPNNGDYTVAMFRPSAANDLNFLGNPYPSAIDADLVMDGNPGVMGAPGVGTTFYFWTHNTQYVGGSYLFSDYAAYNRTGGAGTAPGTFVAGGNNAPPNGFISAGQGFMVKATAAGNMTFRNNMRVAGNNLQFFRLNPSNEKSRIWLDYTNVNNVEEFKQLLVGYIPNATHGYEDGFDGEVIEAGSTIGFYSLAEQDNKHLMIQGRATPFDSTDQVPLGYRATAASTYQIALSNQDGLFEDSLVGIYLEDTLLGVIHDLRQAPYQFVTEAGTFDTRFVLRYNNGFLSVDPSNFNENNVVVFKENEQIHVETSLVKMKSVQIFDLQGRLVMAKNDINSQSAILQKVGLANQVLMVQITSVDGAIVNKKIIF
ncbi:MAG: T9SS sorting signal type C domain-containing protein [Flavobacterium sp.]|nr:T9SS sorting signal type C domain-containing protein [Flavobacterium sp.]